MSLQILVAAHTDIQLQVCAQHWKMATSNFRRIRTERDVAGLNRNLTILLLPMWDYQKETRDAIDMWIQRTGKTRVVTEEQVLGKVKFVL